MKSKMRITGNRTVIGIICIVLALGITFGIAPLVNRFTDRKVEVVQVKQNVERGHLTTEDDVELVKVGALNLSDRTVKNKKYVVGKYAATNLYAGQIMIADLVAEKSNSADDVLSALDGTKVAISVNIASFAQGLSNKLRNGDNEAYNITQAQLLMAALRFDPDIICVGEMRDREAYSAIEASSTDHTVVSTVHGGGGRFAHRRIASLAYQNFEKQSLQQAALAFPVVVFAHKLEDNSRKVMDITECVVGDDGELIYRKLWQYRIYCNEYENGRFRVEGKFERVNPISDSLRLKLLRGGVPQELLGQYTGKEQTE